MQEVVGNEIVPLMNEKHIENVSTVNDKKFNQPTVITVKENKGVKNVLDARELNKPLVKGKFQMPNMEHLTNLVAGH